MADDADSKSVGGDTVWVQVPPPAPKIPNAIAFGIFTYWRFYASPICTAYPGFL